MIHITALSPEELSQIIASSGQPLYRKEQIYQWIYTYYADSFDQMSNLPIPFREELKGKLSLAFPLIIKVLTSKDGTQKFLLKLSDDALIETVTIREGGRLTLCLSTQAGCAQGCSFCVTGHIPFQRSLLHHEITDQALVVSRFLKKEIVTNIVIMGMGEPLANYSEVIQALRTLIDKKRGGFSSRRITLSTVGIASGIEKLGNENLGIRLAVSLNAPNDKIRDALMPVNRRFPLADLMTSLRLYPLRPGQKITLEYCLIRGINDSLGCAIELASLLKRVKHRIKVNLIPYNTNPILPFLPATNACIERFHGYLIQQGIMSTLRKSKGGDILAACGQLGYESNLKTGMEQEQ